MIPRLGERPPTAGLPPRLTDLLARGETGDRLATEIARAAGAPGAVILSSGSACLVTAFTLLAKSSSRRTVVIPAYTCPLVVLAARQAGLDVIACDMARDRFDLDPDHLAHLVDADTLCVVPTHFGGWLTDVGAVRALVAAKDSAVRIVEDAAQAFGATWNGTSVGLAGDIGVFSFAAGKGFTLFEGGALVAPAAAVVDALRATARAIAKPAPLDEAAMAAMLAGYHLAYNPLGIGFAYGRPKRRALDRGDEITAARDHFEPPILVHEVGRWRRSVGLRALPRLNAHLAKARSTFDRLVARLSTLTTEVPGLVVHAPVGPARPSATFVMVTLPEGARADAIILELWRGRSGVSKLFTRAIGDYPFLAGLLRPSDTPNARRLAERTIVISTAAMPGAVPGDDEIGALIEALRNCGTVPSRRVA